MSERYRLDGGGNVVDACSGGGLATLTLSRLGCIIRLNGHADEIAALKAAAEPNWVPIKDFVAPEGTSDHTRWVLLDGRSRRYVRSGHWDAGRRAWLSTSGGLFADSVVAVTVITAPDPATFKPKAKPATAEELREVLRELAGSGAESSALSEALARANDLLDRGRE